VTDSLGGTTISVYDGGRLTRRSFSDATTGAQLRVDFLYDPNGNLHIETRYADLAGTELVGQITYTPTGLGEIAAIQQTDGSGAVVGSYSYHYNLNGWLCSETDNGATTNYGYDGAGELTSVSTSSGTTSYSYDLAGNRTNAGNVPGVDNQLQSDGTWNYSYDLDGNLLTKANISSGVSWAYTYNNAGQQTSATEKASDGSTLISESNTFDVFGNLLSQAITDSSGTQTTLYAYDGSGNAIADLNASGGVLMRRLYLDGQNTPVAREDASGDVGWYLTDHLGSVRAITDDTGSVQDQITYDAFGNATQSDPTVGDRYQYAGMQFDSVTVSVL